MSKQINTRAAAAKICSQIIDKGQSLDAALAWYFENSSHSPQDRGFIQELVYGVCRWNGELDSIAAQLLRSPIRNKDRVVHFVLLVGLYQLKHIDTADHAAVGETVSACKQLNKMWAKNLVNGCLRTYLRETPEPIEYHDKVSHPRWIVEKLNKAWPEHSGTIMEANNQRPPMCLRVNSQQFTREDYLQALDKAGVDAIADPYARDGIILQRAVAVTKLPQFDTGACSVQDTAAQLAADFLQLQKNLTVLDACAAPGGKTAHMLERMENQANMHALDISARRCEQLKSTLARLQLNAQISVADASRADSWQAATDGYDRILIDAPCSGLGVIRRHPDIKHHRRLSDLETLNKIQYALLQNLWAYVKPNGLMLYMTCSVLPSENEAQMVEFIASQNDAMLEKIDHPNALTLQYGVQTLPGVHGMDGFYYSLLRKRPE
ncbi:MAG: 16S rRNA (cytosine967-C5)-methyltransferase [Cryomorphaceae bacterium]|jgi:16S rRNA (cytosine967-C5)-methyltransferase